MPRLTEAAYARLLRAQARPAPSTLPAPSEAQEQAAVIEWAHMGYGGSREFEATMHNDFISALLDCVGNAQG